MVWNLATRRKSRQNARIKLGTLKAEDDNVHKFIESCCGDVQKNSPLNQGVQLFAEQARERMLSYELATSAFLAVLPAKPDTPYLDRQLELSFVVAGLLQKSTTQTTIDHLAQQLLSHFSIDTSESSAHENVVRQLVFAAIGWTTMLYTAQYDTTDTTLHIAAASITHSRYTSQKIVESSKRPIGALLRGFGMMPVACPPGASLPKDSTEKLPVTHMNYCSLTRLGKIVVVWTDDLSKHCKFERYSKEKTLYLFRLPSLCAKLCLNMNGKLPIERIFGCHPCKNDCHAQAGAVAKSYLVEVLLSYRLLFGQHRRSRKLFREVERSKAKWNGKLDPLLDTLCGEEDLEQFSDLREHVRERGVYSAAITFPHLGPRLLELEDYSSSQRPNSLWEVWNDARDSEKMWTFKAVIIVGGLSLLLSFIQILVGIAQVVVGAKA